MINLFDSNPYNGHSFMNDLKKEFDKNMTPKEETLEEVGVVKRTDLYNSILSIVKQIPRENVESDAMDATSCAYEIEQLFYKWQEVKQEIEKL